MNNTKIQKMDEASRPLLVCVNKINSTLPKTKYVVYYRNPMYQDEQVYKNLDNLRELFLPNRQMQLKIINFQTQQGSVRIKNNKWSLSNGKLIVSFSFLQFTIVLEGSIINQSLSNQSMVNLSFIEKKGYDDFYKFRKKYKTLQNITRKISFKIDHRLKMTIKGRQYKFDLQDKKKQQYFVNIDSFQSSVQIVLQQITSIEDMVQVDKIEQLEIDLRQMVSNQNSYRSRILFTNKLQISFLFNIIKNQNYSQADFVAIRLLEVTGKSSYAKIGTEDTINSSNCLKINPLLYGKYYDYEWGYLNDNIKEFEGGSNIYEYLQKLTKSSPKYAHFVNQEIIDLKMSSFVVFEIDGSKLKIPIAYILKGFNYIENDKVSIKFFVDTSDLVSETLSYQQKDHKRLYSLKIEDIWNFNKMNVFLDKSNCNQFTIKILNEGAYYFIPFQRKYVNKQQLRKQSKQLELKNEISSKDSNKYYSIQKNNKNKDQLTIIQTVGICPFYIMKFTSSSSLSFQMIVDGSIAFEGSLTKEKIISNQDKSFVHLLSSVEGSYKIGMVVTFNEISQPAESAATYYNFKHRLFFAEIGQTQDTTYDIQIQFEKDSKIKPLRSKLSPEMKKQSKQAIVLRQFPGVSGVFKKEQILSFTLKIKKMFYNDRLNFFDNQILISKQIFINPTTDLLISKNGLMVKLQKQCYQGLEFDFYDVNIKKRIKYYLEIYAQKNQFLDYKDSSYKIRVPSILWNFNKGFKQQQPGYNYQMTVHLSRKSKNTEKISFDDNNSQDFILNHHNYKDGFTIKRESDLAYSKFMNAVKLKCDVLKENIGWSGQNQWFFAVMSFSTQNFYFLIQRMFDPYEDKRKKSGSSRSNKTVSRQQSARSDKHKIDPLAKTISNLDLFKLKKKKNQLIAQGRQLTARYVKRQQKIIDLTKQLSDLGEQIKKKQQQEQQAKNGKKKMKKQNTKMKEFYRSICQCGARNPQFNGYCDECLKKLKDRYQTYLKQFKQKSYLYEKMIFEKFNQKQKINKLEKKIQRLKNQEIYGEEQQQGPQILMKDMQEKGLRKAIEDLKIDIFEIDEERASLVSTSNWQMKILEQKISKEDGKIYQLSQQYDSLKNKLTSIVKMMKKDPQ